MSEFFGQYTLSRYLWASKPEFDSKEGQLDFQKSPEKVTSIIGLI